MNARSMGSGTLATAHRVGDVAAPGAPVVLAGRPVPVVGTARVYVCGITPYDVTHLGHAATFVWADVVAAVLGADGAEVEVCRNVTDVDDVLLDVAASRGRHYDELALLQEAEFERTMTTLRVATPRHRPRSRHHVDAVVHLATALLAAGAAYERDGTVWSRGADVATTAGLDDTRARELAAAYGDVPDAPDDPGGDGRDGRDHPLDVAVWRPSAEGEPAWPSPWGWGRPGWHAECAAMALAVHGASVDVLVGGADLAFPHHAHQAAMVQAATGVTPFARAVVHVGTVEVDGAKMAKSTGNLVLVDDLLADWSPATLRLALLDRPWAQGWSWDDSVLPAAQQRLDALHAAAGRPGRPGGADVVTAAVDRLRDDLDVSGAVDVAIEAGGETARRLVGLLRLA